MDDELTGKQIDLPPEVMHEILSRLPVKPLCRFKLVSKPWLSLISNPKFIAMYSKAIENNKDVFSQRRRLVFTDGENLSLYSLDLDQFLDHNHAVLKNRKHNEDVDGPVAVATELDFVYNLFPKGRRQWFPFIHSCNSLLLSESCYGYRLINPVAKESKKLPKTPTWRWKPGFRDLYGFGYDYSTKEYKVVIGQFFYGHGTVFSVYTLETDSWRRIKGLPCIPTPDLSRDGIVVNGGVHCFNVIVNHPGLNLSLRIIEPFVASSHDYGYYCSKLLVELEVLDLCNIYFEIVAFLVLLSLIVTNIVLSGAGVLYFYTQWTFCLVTIYFGLGSLLSIYGCYRYQNRVGEDAADHVRDEEQGNYVAPTLGENADTSNMSKSFTGEEFPSRKAAGVYVYIFQVIYQMCGGAVVLTDVVFWLILYPFLTSKSYKLNFMMVSMHSFNVVFLLGETILNSLRFPMFRISYFVLWTGIFVIYQWIIHAFKNMWWPYPFLDLASPYAPLWYLGVGVMHIPCYGVFALIIKMKQLWFSRSFPESFQGER
ncbi:hypothetical protein ACLB2K_038991 [Fragaria x ananassa]